VFHVKAYKKVTHDDRDVEFIMLKHRIQEFMIARWPDHNFGPMSCEMIAEKLMNVFELSQCEVSEDGENGAVLKRIYGHVHH